MNTFLLRITALIEAIGLDDVHIADLGPVSEGEKVIGEVTSDFTKKALILKMQLVSSVVAEKAKILGNFSSPGELIESIITESNGDHVAVLGKLASIESSFDKLKPEAYAKMRDAEYLQRLFWNSVREESPEARLVEKLGVREGWQIVTLAEEDENYNCSTCTLKRVLGGKGPFGLDVRMIHI